MIVYCITNTVTGKQYVGQTTGTLKNRLYAHKHVAKKGVGSYRLSRAIRRYGFESFTARVLQECASGEELDAAEIAWIERLQTTAPKGYNVRGGGSHGLLDERTKEGDYTFLSWTLLCCRQLASFGGQR